MTVDKKLIIGSTLLFLLNAPVSLMAANVTITQTINPGGLEILAMPTDMTFPPLRSMRILQTNYAIPEMNGVGAMESCVSTVAGVCDFISAMDTARIQEWNTWYHLLNCGFPLKVSGETDFPCMSSRRVGLGRVYVHLGEDAKLDFAKWCDGLAAGRSYVSDGYAHLPSM